jgi:hypothetical protein
VSLALHLKAGTIQIPKRFFSSYLEFRATEKVQKHSNSDGNDYSSFIKFWEILDQLSDWWPVKKGSA